jgi:signal transduction histidine kinase
VLGLAESARRFSTTLDPVASGAVSTRDVAAAVRSVGAAALVSYPSATVSTETPPTVPANAHETFELAVEELVDNAVEHCGEDVDVSLSVDVVGDEVVVRVSDDGPGVPERDRRSLNSGRESQLQHTGGLGLWFVRWMSVNSGGSFEVHSEDGDGTTVELRLPAA